MPVGKTKVNVRDLLLPTFLDENLIHVAEPPVFAGLERLDDWVLGRLKVFGGVAVGARIATTDMPVGETLPQVDPGVAGFEALLAALGRGLHVAYLVEMAALLLHGRLLCGRRLGGYGEDGF